MFVTTPDLAIPVPHELREPAMDYWAAFRLSNESPWFLITLAQNDENGLLTQTVGVAWESTLRSLIETSVGHPVLAIRRLSASDRGAGDWTMQDITEVWRPAPSEEEETGPVLLRVATESGLRNSHHKPVTREVPGRCLLARIAC